MADPPPRPCLPITPSELPPEPFSRLALELSEDQRTLRSVVRRLSKELRKRRLTKVPHFSVDALPLDWRSYCTRVLVHPALQLLSCLRGVSQPLLDCIAEESHQDFLTIAITTEDATTTQMPNILFFNAKLFQRYFENANGILSARTTVADCVRSKVHLGKVVLCTDLESVIVFRSTADSSNSGISFEYFTLPHSLASLRIIIAGYIRDGLPEKYIALPRRYYGRGMMPAGCVVRPDSPLQPDERVFETHRHHSDFDFYSLTKLQSHALQFFRWKMHALSTPPAPLLPSTRILGRTNAFQQRHATLRPFYEVEDLSTETVEHISKTLRKDPLYGSGIQTSTAFELEIVSDLTPLVPPAADREAFIYRCRLVSVDGAAWEGAGDVCLKVFDDRQLFMEYPEEYLLKNGVSPVCWHNWTTNEDSVRQEHGIYTRLAFMHGSLLPWYYGAHEFVLPDGRVLYGILMEYIDGPSLEGLDASHLSDEEQIQLIKSIRQAIAALQNADVSQADWHSEQMLCIRSPDAGLHCVLIDFVRCSTTVDPDFFHGRDDVCNCGMMLADEHPGYVTGLRKHLIDTHFRWREDWDTRKSWDMDDSIPDPYDFQSWAQ
ncbi:hypothetical protein CYLTODRAFT_374134 [Cylindrobasidium torrendii FP15055 ss-10]|uniref:Protein kinase domain-containing protein n=1 Tax=Cylindrobasidium torrendii FP15055 ss-10 TaxID=1314674 RepID=A0A0D7BEK7_9AGAR|nr:hypothetical protein CYLTODRAFT_374134 [Cylindrobasidium torrendii FP15055 ss-10]